jgi:DNA polymerase-3 subunit delta'
MAAADTQELLRYDAVEGWPAPEERAEWLGDVAAERTLLDAYRSGRMHHAWLIGGPKGVGKATLAYRFARFLFAHPDPASPAVAAATDLSLPEDHPAFRKVARRAHPNLLVLERPYDARNNRYKSELTVDEIRRTVAFYGTTSGEAGWRVAIVDPADDMNANAANALLKVLEEPPSRSLFLVVSHAPGRSLPTIRSRCRRLELAPLSDTAIVSALTAEADDGDPDDLALAARLAEGSLRRAILLADGGGIATYRAFAKLLSRLPDIDMSAAHDFADSVTGRGNEDGWTGFVDMTAGWLNRRVRGESEPETGVPLSPAAAAAPLERWAEVWENLRASSALTDEYNLDRKRTVLTVLMTLARATRM